MEAKVSQAGRKLRFSQTDKEKILREHRDKGTPLSQLARENGIHAVTIYQWRRNLNMKSDKTPDAISPDKIRDLLTEIAELKKENKQLKVKVADLAVGNDILTEAIEIQKKRNLLKQLGLHEKSKKPKNSK
jgi:transposase-like protein